MIDIFNDDINKLFGFVFRIGSKFSRFISDISDILLNINKIRLKNIKIILIWQMTFISLVVQYMDNNINNIALMIIGVR